MGPASGSAACLRCKLNDVASTIDTSVIRCGINLVSFKVRYKVAQEPFKLSSLDKFMLK